MHKQKTPVGIKIISVFYFLLASAIACLFIYAHIVTPMTFWNKLSGVLLALLLGFSVFFIARNVWKGQSWARIVIIIINSGIILTGIWFSVFARIVSMGAIIYIISILLIKGFIIVYLFSKNARRYFIKSSETFKLIREEIKKLYEKDVV